MTSCTNRCMTMKVAGCFQFAEDSITIFFLCGEEQVVREKRSCTLTLGRGVMLQDDPVERDVEG